MQPIFVRAVRVVRGLYYILSLFSGKSKIADSACSRLDAHGGFEAS
jgi:hypothetical protein